MQRRLPQTPDMSEIGDPCKYDVSGRGDIAEFPDLHDDYMAFVNEFRRLLVEGRFVQLDYWRGTGSEHGFNNLDDLGPGFGHYGPGMIQWPQLMRRARRNRWRQTLSKVIQANRHSKAYSKATQGGTMLPLMLVQKAIEERPAPQEIHEPDAVEINNQTTPFIDQLD
jgi:hypothetical protein